MGGLELDSAGDSDNEYEEDEGNHAAENGPKDWISVIRGSSLWILIRDSLCPPEVLVLRTALLTKGGSEERDPVTLPEWPLSLKLRFRSKHDRVGQAARHDRLQLHGRMELSRQREMEVCKQKHSQA